MPDEDSPVGVDGTAVTAGAVTVIERVNVVEPPVFCAAIV
jgi:hypothetical protein